MNINALQNKPLQVVWLASFPRSGNTLLRTIMHHCLGLYSGSVYKRDLGDNKALHKYVGHIEHNENGTIDFPPGNIPLIKTHQYPKDNKPAIYVVRDGRAACLSMLDYYKGQINLESIITGMNRFGTWADHLVAWRPWDRPNTLFIKYEDMVKDLPKILKEISEFLQCPIKAEQIPGRNSIAGVDGKWVRKEKKKKLMPYEFYGLFTQINGEMMEKAGYMLPDGKFKNQDI